MSYEVKKDKTQMHRHKYMGKKRLLGCAYNIKSGFILETDHDLYCKRGPLTFFLSIQRLGILY